LKILSKSVDTVDAEASLEKHNLFNRVLNEGTEQSSKKAPEQSLKKKV
jgi:hypothetical protein